MSKSCFAQYQNLIEVVSNNLYVSIKYAGISLYERGRDGGSIERIKKKKKIFKYIDFDLKTYYLVFCMYGQYILFFLIFLGVGCVLKLWGFCNLKKRRLVFTLYSTLLGERTFACHVQRLYGPVRTFLVPITTIPSSLHSLLFGMCLDQHRFSCGQQTDIAKMLVG